PVKSLTYNFLKINLMTLAIYIILNAAINNTLTNATIIQCIIIMVLSIIIGSFTKYFSAILQTEAGYTTAANKRIDIAEHLKYLPMGYFNKNSLGYITSITTNTMENLADVATRVVLLTTQGLLTTIIIDIYIFVFDFRIGIILTIGMILFLFSNSLMQNKSEKISPLKIQSDTKLVEKVIEYVMGIAEIKAFNTSNKIIKDLYKAIDNNQNTNIQLEITFIPYMAMQTIIIKLTGIFMTIFSIYFYIDGTIDLLIYICMMICSFMVLLNLEQAGQYSSLLRIVDLSVDKANEIFRIQPIDIDGKNIIPDNYNIEAHNVEFAYDFKKIINDISLKIPEHTTTAIVGPSGSGKQHYVT
ncbi:MAG: ABC transporter ATP-binding protein/permease, partial [Erysipelotrichaceae bacterium]|nr:ABC transporter ATP-binding protein/permease [Erysipelotrichaceae bacterium]